LIKFNPVIATDPERGEATAREVFSPERVVQLLAVADRDWVGAIFLGYGCGGRLQDIANPRWSALDTERGVVSFRERVQNQTKLPFSQCFRQPAQKRPVCKVPEFY
jgi:integrase